MDWTRSRIPLESNFKILLQVWYNEEHRHSDLRFITPAQRHRGEDRIILGKRQIVYTLAKARHLERWPGQPRKWTPIGTVWLNPDREVKPTTAEFLKM